MSVAYAAALVLVVTLAVMAVDWRRLGRDIKSRFIVRSRPARTVTAGIGWRIITDHRLEVSSTQVYSNGTTQIWLKRKAA